MSRMQAFYNVSTSAKQFAQKYRKSILKNTNIYSIIIYYIHYFARTSAEKLKKEDTLL